MKKIFVSVFLFFLGYQAIGQIGNEWIRFNQQYFKVSVAQDGIYRLSYAELVNAGFPVGSDYRRIQLFHRGEEQSIRIVKTNPGILALEPTDYIEFYGKRNTGEGDVELYKTPEAQPHPYHNLYSDSSHYFLTVNTLLVQGKRMNDFFEVNVGGLPAEEFHTDEKLTILATQYFTGLRFNDGFVQYSYFDEAEGWTGQELRQNELIDYTIENINQGAASIGLPQLEILLVGRADVAHAVEIAVGATLPSRVVTTASFSGYATNKVSVPLNWSDIGADGRMVVRVRALGVGGAADRVSASYIKVTYPQRYHASGVGQKFFNTRNNGPAKSYVEIQSAPVNARLFDVTDPTDITLIGTTQTTTLNAIVPNTIASRKLLLTNTFLTPAIRKIQFRGIDPAAHNYLIISHADLRQPADSYNDPVKAYAAYRASDAGGNFDTLVVNIDQLYNQFNYGEVSPLAIRRFMKLMVEQGSPRYLFLIGKGLDVRYNYYRNPSSFTAYKDLVPTAGNPGSDIAFTSGLGGTQYEPAVATGRITANTAAEVAAYLNKVKEMEALPFDALWRKELLHLSGGIYNNEPEIFRFYLEGFANIANDKYLGGKISAIAKNKTDLEFINISEKINNGVNLVTLFGHSSASQGDFNIGFVSAAELGYDNKGKYPMFLINGCNAGEFFNNQKLYGEDWILAANKGALGFMANTSFGFSNALRNFSNTFYQVAYGDSTFIYKGIGDILKETSRRFLNISTSGIFITQSQQMLLLGDPAVSLFGASKPDYEINDASVIVTSLNEEPVTSRSDTIALEIITRNFGRVKEDSVHIRVERILNDNSTITYDSLFPPTYFQDTIIFKIPNAQNQSGNNSFTIIIDPEQTINELSEENNIAVVGYFIPSNAAKNLFPQPFGIVNQASVNLVVQSTNVLDEVRDFIIQVDTVDTFDSPYLQQFTVNGKIATHSFTVLQDRDSLAYYWRTRFSNPQPGESTDWSMSTFSFVNNSSEGWTQLHFPQFTYNATGDELVVDRDSRRISFKETVTPVELYTFGATFGGTVNDVSVKLGGTEYIVSDLGTGCRTNTLNLISFSKTTTVPYLDLPVISPDARACGRRPEVIASFRINEFENATAVNLIQYIDNVAEGDSVILYTIGDAGFSLWSATVLTKLGELGISSSQLSGLTDGEPLIIYAKKGAAIGTAQVIRATVPSTSATLENTGSITGRRASGKLITPVIGPALAWESLVINTTETEFNDEIFVQVIGITLQGARDTLFNANTNINPLVSIDASIYPYLQFVYTVRDEINLSPAQLANWFVFYTPAPEGVLMFNSPLSQTRLDEGDTWMGEFSFTNISNGSFPEQLKVRYGTITKQTRFQDVQSVQIPSPNPGETTTFSIGITTVAKGGLNDISIFVNPRVTPELYYDNNVLDLADHLDVVADVYNPIIDVTVDGRYINNGDIVSSNPLFAIRLWDENSYLFKTDTVGIQIFVKYPCGTDDCPYVPIYFSSELLNWTPASTSSDFMALLGLQNLTEGMHTLRVAVTDARGNTSGNEPLEISFQVVNEKGVTISSPYPNPSSGVTKFSIVIAGDSDIQNGLLEVVALDGRTIRKVPVQNLVSGSNYIIWDSTDVTGSYVPNGIYIYKIVLAGSSGTFTGSGKIVINR